MAKKSEKNFAQKVCFLQGLSSKMRYLDLTWIVAAPRNESIFSTNLYARNNFYFTRSQSLTVHHKPYYSEANVENFGVTKYLTGEFKRMVKLQLELSDTRDG